MDDLSEKVPRSTDDGLPSEQYESILRNIHDAVYTLDANGRITWVNEVAIEEFDSGYSRDDLIGAPVRRVLSEEDIAKCTEIIANLLENDEHESGRCEVSIQTVDGDEIPCDLHLALFPFEEGEFQGTIGVLRDITDRKRREQGRMVLNRVLRHNLRNRLNVIKGHAEVFEHSSDGEPSHLQSIIDAVEELERLAEKARRVDELLTEDGRSIEPIEAVELVEKKYHELQAQFPEAELSLETPSSVWVRADHRFETVIENLLENAIGHSDRDCPLIEVSITANAKTAGWVEIRFADDGPAIPSMEIESVTSGVETPLNHGSGLGLWLVKWLVEGYDGELAFEERSPRGNAVIVRLRQADPPAG